MSNCRFCRNTLSSVVVDLGMSPVSNAFLRADQLNQMEPFYPLRVLVCNTCLLVQTEDFETPENIFNDHYAYFSSASKPWVDHAREYVEKISTRFDLSEKNHSLVVEIASNDGYLLQFFEQRKILTVGVEPSANVAAAAKKNHNIETWVKFFNTDTARELVERRGRADLIVGNNVLAHVPDLNDFVAGLKILLADGGVITMEFPHLLSLINENQFDTIYHEHYSYFSLLAVDRIFRSHGLRIFDVERLTTHGGSLRIYATHLMGSEQRAASVTRLINAEIAAGLDSVATYAKFTEQVRETKRELLSFLLGLKFCGRTIVGYGAPAKGNTLLNYCGIGRDFIDYTVDSTPHKQGMFLPGTHIPIYAPEKIFETKPDWVLILPWNWKDEIIKKTDMSSWGGRFVTAIPHTSFDLS